MSPDSDGSLCPACGGNILSGATRCPKCYFDLTTPREEAMSNPAYTVLSEHDRQRIYEEEKPGTTQKLP